MYPRTTVHPAIPAGSYQAKVVVLKNKLGRAGQQANLAITFNGTVRGDGT